MESFDAQVERLDAGLFRHVVSQSTEEDRRSLLALQAVARQPAQGYTYLEIGSYMGGSLQPHVADPRCRQILSIDPRVASSPDERGGRWPYAANTTQAMLEGLAKVPGADLAKIRTFSQGTDTLPLAELKAAPDLCFVDGEHTDAAVLRDARFCLQASGERGCIAFHDAHIVYRGLLDFITELRAEGRSFSVFHLSDTVVFLEFGGCRFSEQEPLRSRLRENCAGYLWSLMANDPYRRSYYHPLLHWYRQIKSRTWGRVTGRLRHTQGMREK